MKWAYYNENHKPTANWLRALISKGLIAPGEVDDRSILEVNHDDIKGFKQCHFFAGIGGWSLALRLAGWSDDQPAWTGSPPCQPFSIAGRGLGESDPRHLAPTWLRLIDFARPRSVFGEQSGEGIRKGWFDTVQDALEGSGYACGAAIFPSCSVGAPHLRQRLYFAAQKLDDTTSARHFGAVAGAESDPWDQTRLRLPSAPSGQGDTGGAWSGSEWVECSDGHRAFEPGTFPLANGVSSRVVRLRGYGNAINPHAAAAFIRSHRAAVAEIMPQNITAQ